jgi:hypothetical protein
MTCFYCGRVRSEEQLPRGWKTCGRLVVCRECRREHYRLRMVTMALVPPMETCHLAIEEALSRTTPLVIPGACWEPRFAEDGPFLDLFMGNQWWAVRLETHSWSRARKAAYDSLVSGEALAGELLLCRRILQRDARASEIVCKTVAWLPLNAWTPRRKDHIAFGRYSIEEIDIKNLRAAIRANRVSFPSQIPSFPSSASPELQCKLVQLYFILGWNCADIAERYGILEQRVRDILHGWKFRAANAGYIQHIPPEQSLDRLKILSLVRTRVPGPPAGDEASR